MEIGFRTARLRRSYEDSSRAIQEWGAVVGRSYVTRINMLSELKNFQAAYGVRAFRLHPLHGARRGEISIYLAGRWRLIVTEGDTDDSVIIEEVSNHYDD